MKTNKHYEADAREKTNTRRTIFLQLLANSVCFLYISRSLLVSKFSVPKNSFHDLIANRHASFLQSQEWQWILFGTSVLFTSPSDSKFIFSALCYLWLVIPHRLESKWNALWPLFKEMKSANICLSLTVIKDSAGPPTPYHALGGTKTYDWSLARFIWRNQ